MVKLSDDQALYYSSNSDEGSLPITEFVLSEGLEEEQSVCINKEDYILPDKKQIYPLLNTNFYRGCVSNVDGLQ